jgi:hypothetical protein
LLLFSLIARLPSAPVARTRTASSDCAFRAASAAPSARHDLTVSIDDLELQMRMVAADRADAPLGRLIR